MNGTTETNSGSAAEALGAVSDEGIRRQSTLHRISVRLGVRPVFIQAALLTIAAALAVTAYRVVPDMIDKPDPSAAAGPRGVAILLPCSDAESPQAGSSLKKVCTQLNTAALPQIAGFDLVKDERQTFSDPAAEYYYRFPLPDFRDQEAAAVLNALDEEFESMYVHGTRYFIVTMSDTVLKLTVQDGIWAKFLARHLDDPPILIATVASAPLPPGADISRGVIRNYIRSGDEVNQFAAYIDSQNIDVGERQIIVIYIDDGYGQEAVGLIGDKLDKDAEENAIPVRTGREIDPTTERLSALDKLKAQIDGEKHSFVILVGYGDMVSEMLKLLNDEARDQAQDEREGTGWIDEVLVVSTLTEAAWQPAFYKGQGQDQFLPRISTLFPFTAGDRKPPANCEGAVCQFSFMTLWIVLTCAEQPNIHGIDSFFHCFVNQEQRGARSIQFPDIELSANGDSIVPLRVKVSVARH
jgi:hypothetical protein